MQVEIVVPQMGESISEATVASWLVAKGDAVAEGDVLVELETDKVMVEVPAAEGGVVLEIRKPEGDSVTVGDILGLIDTEASGNGAGAKAAPEAAPEAAPRAAPKGEPEAAPKTESEAPAPAAAQAAPAAATSAAVGPAARRLAEEHGVDLAQVSGTGPRGQVTKDDVQRQVDGKGSAAPRAAPAAAPAPAGSAARAPAPAAPRSTQAPGEREERVKMTRLRLRIAERLLEAQQSAAILTTFNEVDMGAAMALRAKYKEAFQKKYGVAIGFMSVFTKACIEALKAFPAVNAEIQGDEIVYKRFYDIGVAVGTERGLVVPIVRDADVKSFIEIELEIAALAGKARENKLSMDDLTGGTFTISNGGIYGSMLSTPILNPPQVGILGMHNIVKRPVVVNDQIEVRPMMYLALSYDHRIIDGREAVQFLIRVRECVEDPARILLEI